MIIILSYNGLKGVKYWIWIYKSPEKQLFFVGLGNL
jgi:hypothetical protein